jgi:hypothetical protein
MSSDWYARKFGGAQQRPQPQPQYTQRTYVQGNPAPAEYAPQPMHREPDTQAIRVTPENFSAVAGLWKGGQATKTEQYPCPSCGSNLYYSRSGKSRLPSPAPHCFSCGYNGLFDQGTPQAWGN